MPQPGRKAKGPLARQYSQPKLDLAGLVLSGLCASVQAELDGFFSTLGGAADRLRHVSAQASSEPRRGFSAMRFTAANAHPIPLA